MSSTDTEIELKLALVKGGFGRVRKALDLKLDRALIEDVYFDTAGAALRNRGLVLRLRRDGDHWLQTLKATNGARSLVPERGEWEVALPAAAGPPELDLERFDITPLRVLMRGGLEPASLVPVFKTRIARRRGVLLHGQSEIEVAFDRGELKARVEGRKRRLKVAELELELKSGRPEDLLAAGASIIRRCDEATLVPALRSKSERGYALKSDETLKAVRASSRGFAELIDPPASAADALRAVMRHGIAIVVANADALRSSPAGEHIHQARVALRRMRSAARLFDPACDDFPPRLGKGLRWLARTLGEARDWDVIVEETLPSILSALDSADTSHAPLLRAARKQRDRALQRAIDTIGSRGYARLILRLARWSLTEGRQPGKPVEQLAPELLEEAADRLFKDARAFGRLGQHRQHRVRIHAKRLRYALDLLASSLPARGAADYIDALAELQDSLGELNDATVALSRLAPLTSGSDDERLLHKWHDQARQELVARAARQLRALSRRPRPWSLV